jgi:hypothetical protein
VAAVATLLIALAAAHHSVLPFDGATPTTVDGTVTGVLWQNPHTLIALDVEGERWTIESDGAGILERLGWTKSMLTVGDRLVVVGARAKDGRRLLRCQSVTTQDRKKLTCFG